MCPTTEDLKEKAEWDGAEGTSRHRLLSDLSSKFTASEILVHELTLVEWISPSVMLPEHRLAILLDQVKRNQISRCLYHHNSASPSLYQDHTCDRNRFPVSPVLELDKHSGEVYQVKFSNDGTCLASCGEDGTCIIYEVGSFEVLQSLACQSGSVTSFAWSPDDSMIVTCSTDKHATLWNAHVCLNFLA
jgi:WD40 repeat protein